MSHIKLPKYLGSCKMHCCVLALSWSHYAYFPSLTIDIALVASHYTSETVFQDQMVNDGKYPYSSA